jgi:hypothetical protein
VLRGVLRDATEAFLAVLDTYTLADLIKPQKAMLSLLIGQQQQGSRIGVHRASIRMTEVGSETTLR